MNLIKKKIQNQKQKFKTEKDENLPRKDLFLWDQGDLGDQCYIIGGSLLSTAIKKIGDHSKKPKLHRVALCIILNL